MYRDSISKSVRFSVFDRDNYACVYCGRKPPDVQLEIDHVIPVCDGGDNSIENLVSACQDCNRGKGGKTFDNLKNKGDGEIKFKSKETKQTTFRLKSESIEILDWYCCEYKKNKSDAIRDAIKLLKNGSVSDNKVETHRPEVKIKELKETQEALSKRLEYSRVTADKYLNLFIEQENITNKWMEAAYKLLNVTYYYETEILRLKDERKHIYSNSVIHEERAESKRKRAASLRDNLWVQPKRGGLVHWIKKLHSRLDRGIKKNGDKCPAIAD